MIAQRQTALDADIRVAGMFQSLIQPRFSHSMAIGNAAFANVPVSCEFESVDGGGKVGARYDDVDVDDWFCGEAGDGCTAYVLDGDDGNGL